MSSTDVWIPYKGKRVVSVFVDHHG